MVHENSKEFRSCVVGSAESASTVTPPRNAITKRNLVANAKRQNIACEAKQLSDLVNMNWTRPESKRASGPRASHTRQLALKTPKIFGFNPYLINKGPASGSAGAIFPIGMESKRVALCRCLIKTIKYVGSATSSFAVADSQERTQTLCPDGI